MTAAEKASQNATTMARRSVHQPSFLCAFVQALVRPTGHRREAAIGAVPRGDRAEQAASAIRWLAQPKTNPLHEPGEDDPIRDAWPVAAQGMRHLAIGQQRRELVPDWLDDR